MMEKEMSVLKEKNVEKDIEDNKKNGNIPEAEEFQSLLEEKINEQLRDDPLLSISDIEEDTVEVDKNENLAECWL